jgi:Flp pilus assembly protein TadG
VDLIMLLFRSPLKLLRDRRGVAAAEFALIAPALIGLVVGVLEMSMRFRAKEEATRFVHQVADLISRENTLTTDMLETIYGASLNMMKPLDTTDRLDFDVASVGFDEDGEPEVLWRRVAGDEVAIDLEDAEGLGPASESIIRVGVRYRYESPISALWGGPVLNMVQESFARPRSTRLIPLDGVTDDGGDIVYFESAED